MAILIGGPKAIRSIAAAMANQTSEEARYSLKPIACIELKMANAANDAGIKYTYSGSKSHNPPFSSRVYKAIESPWNLHLEKLPRYSYTSEMLEW